MLLYDSPVSGNCYKVRLLFAHLGLPYERRSVDVVDRSTGFVAVGGLDPSSARPRDTCGAACDHRALGGGPGPASPVGEPFGPSCGRLHGLDERERERERRRLRRQRQRQRRAFRRRRVQQVGEFQRSGRRGGCERERAGEVVSVEREGIATGIGMIPCASPRISAATTSTGSVPNALAMAGTSRANQIFSVRFGSGVALPFSCGQCRLPATSSRTGGRGRRL